ncbi:STAS domain-containing protein [Kitasatospora camelliae]|uniref:STAS domain-containing protein n=1 Tax=Kitasatospora camelliae TaxID=3156397 RepID=A0AAU8JQI2_9ACTN
MSRPPTGHETVVRLRGELDALSAASIEPRLRPLAADRSRDLVLDLTAVTFCDSSGVALFERLNEQRMASTTLVLRGLGRQPRRVICLMGLDRVLTCESEIPVGRPAARH